MGLGRARLVGWLGDFRFAPRERRNSRRHRHERGSRSGGLVGCRGDPDEGFGLEDDDEVEVQLEVRVEAHGGLSRGVDEGCDSARCSGEERTGCS